MPHTREPRVKTVKIIDLRPTQMTVGMLEVEEKRKRWKDQKGSKQSRTLGSHMIPVILGPREKHYVIDHHHLCRALHEEGVKDVLVSVVQDLSAIETDSFWVNMNNRNWMHPYDADGKLKSYKDLPKTIEQLVDDPYRSLAGALRRVGGFAKDTTPFSEFLWADFLRKRVKPKLIKQDFAHALEGALICARSKEAIYLPGWCGPTPDE